MTSCDLLANIGNFHAFVFSIRITFSAFTIFKTSSEVILNARTHKKRTTKTSREGTKMSCDVLTLGKIIFGYTPRVVLPPQQPVLKRKTMQEAQKATYCTLLFSLSTSLHLTISNNYCKNQGIDHSFFVEATRFEATAAVSYRHALLYVKASGRGRNRNFQLLPQFFLGVVYRQI